MASREPAEFQPKPILRTLLEHGVDFVLIGGLAGIARGSSYPSYDVDIASDGIKALKALQANPADVVLLDLGLPHMDGWQLATRITDDWSQTNGKRPLLVAVTGYGQEEDRKRSDKLKAAAGGKADVEGESILVTSLDHLIAMKETSGRTKDKLMATEYRVLSDELRAPEN